MKCPKCESENRKSTMNVSEWGVSTAMMSHSYYDEDGKYHHHDPNSRATEWNCSNGHQGVITTQGGCPTCKDFIREIHVTEAAQ